MNIANPTKRSTKAPTALVRLHVADDIREELSGKLSLIGMFADLVVVANVNADNQTVGTGDDRYYAIDSLAFLVTVSGVKGVHKVSVTYTDESMPARPPGIRDADFGDGSKSVNIVWRFRPYLSNSFGLKKVTVEIDSEKHELIYEIRRGEVSAAQDRPAGEAMISKDRRSIKARARSSKA